MISHIGTIINTGLEMGEEREVLGWIEAVLEEPLPKGDLAKVDFFNFFCYFISRPGGLACFVLQDMLLHLFKDQDRIHNTANRCKSDIF